MVNVVCISRRFIVAVLAYLLLHPSIGAVFYGIYGHVVSILAVLGSSVHVIVLPAVYQICCAIHLVLYCMPRLPVRNFRSG